MSGGPVEESPGTAALDAALAASYPGETPTDYVPQASLAMGGDYPLDLIRVYPVAGPPHWHYIGYGLSQLYRQSSPDPAVPGYDFELTLRLARSPGESAPPLWGCAVLLELGRYLIETGRSFEAGHHIAPRWRAAPGDPPTEIRAFVFARDPGLGRVATPHGSAQFLQAVGITLDESELLERTSAAALLALLGRGNPLLVTDRARPSLLAAPTDDTGALLDEQLSWRREARARTVEVTLGAEMARQLVRTLRTAIPHGKPVILAGGRGSLVVFKPAETSFCQVEPDGLVLGVSPAMLGELDALVPERGVYPLPTLAGVSFHVLPSHIRDAAGKIVHTVG